MSGPDLLAGLLGEVADERARQDVKWGEQNHPDGTGDDVRLFADVGQPTYGTLAYVTRHHVNGRARAGSSLWAPILLEEVFEALAEDDPGRLREELVQVAAVAVQWAAAIDRRTAGRE